MAALLSTQHNPLFWPCLRVDWRVSEEGKGWEIYRASTVGRGAQAAMFGFVDEKKLTQVYYPKCTIATHLQLL